MAMNHNLSRGLSPSTGSYISLENSGRPVRVTGRRGRAEGNARRGSHGGTTDNQKSSRDDAYHNCGKHGHWAKECRQPRRGRAHVAQVEEEEPALLLTYASIELSPVASTVAALLHLLSREHTPSLAMAPATTRLVGGGLTPTPPIT
jgi:hypothetical protein